MLRNVELSYFTDSSIQGIDTLKFRTSPQLWSGLDSRYNYMGKPIHQGTLNISSVSIVKFGTPTSMFASSPHFFNANDSVSNLIVCTNCPHKDDMSIETHISMLEIEPMV